MIGLGFLNFLYWVMLPTGLIYALYFLMDFSDLFQLLITYISVGMILAQVGNIGAAMACQN